MNTPLHTGIILSMLLLTQFISIPHNFSIHNKIIIFMSEERKKLIVISYIDNLLRKLQYYLPNELYTIIFECYNSMIEIIKDDGKYVLNIGLIGDGGTGKSSIISRYVV